MEITGKVVAILPIVVGQSARGEWRRQEVIFEQVDEFNRKICVNFWGDKTQEVARLQVGDMMSVWANVESREHNGRWYTEVRAWRIAPKAAEQAAASSVSSSASTSSLSDMPFSDEMPVNSSESNSVPDDLPF